MFRKSRADQSKIWKEEIERFRSDAVKFEKEATDLRAELTKVIEKIKINQSSGDLVRPTREDKLILEA